MNVFQRKGRKVCSQRAQSLHIPSQLCALCAGLCVLCGLPFLNTVTDYKFRIPIMVSPPLTSLAVIIGLINGTETKNGLTVKVQLDANVYQTGIKIDDKEFANINIKLKHFHGEWNYVITPTLLMI
jgi:hypothetical protein